VLRRPIETTALIGQVESSQNHLSDNTTYQALERGILSVPIPAELLSNSPDNVEAALSLNRECCSCRFLQKVIGSSLPRKYHRDALRPKMSVMRCAHYTNSDANMGRQGIPLPSLRSIVADFPTVAEIDMDNYLSYLDQRHVLF
jgi:hypothetical protein